MAGHNKWSKIKRKKGVNDARRSKIFSKLIKEIHVAARLGGADMDTNSRLRSAVENAKAENMPKDNIERAIKKATGSDATDYEEIIYEGYGPHGVAVVIECATDNLNRTVSVIKAAFNKYGGSMEKKGALSFVFDTKGVFEFIAPENADHDELTLELIDMGAEDVEIDNEGEIILTTARDDFGSVQQKLNKKGINTRQSGLRQIPNIYKKLNPDQIHQVMRFIEALEDEDDIQNVYHNMEIDDEVVRLMDE